MWTNPPVRQNRLERFWTTRTRRSGAKRRTSGRPRPRAIPPSPPLLWTFCIRHLSLWRLAPSGQSSAQSGHCRRIHGQLDLSVGHSFNSSSVSVHRRLDQRDVGFQCTVHPRRIRAPHRRDAVTVLSGDKERIFADHEIPADGGVPGAIGTPEPQVQSL